MISEQQLEERMKQAKPTLAADEDFGAKIMQKIDMLPIATARFSGWRSWALVIAVVAVAVAAGTLGIVHLRTTPITSGKIATDMTNGSSAGHSGTGTVSQNTYYGQLAASAQSDLDSMARQTSGFSSNDYSDSELADIAIYQ